ncbi:MAG: metal-dependent transcriptional regulator [Candidatus Thermoplasmatota archaeon]
MVTESVEEYLEIIYRLCEHKAYTTTVEIAKALNIAPASVSEMLQKMAKKSYVEYTPYKGVALTNKGIRIGKKILRRHRVVESFLAKLGFPKHKLHSEACKLEHSISDDLEKIIDNSVGYPETSPTGKKIPRDRKILALDSLGIGEKGRIVYVKGGIGTVQRLADMGLTRDTEIEVKRSAVFKGPIEILVRGTRLALGRGVCAKIFVELD